MPTVLLIDHEQDVLDSFRVVFEMKGYAVLTATRFKEALRIADEKRVDLVKSGLFMPDMDGFEFLRKFKEQFPTVPLIVSSAYLPEDWPERARAAGAVVCFQRPFELGGLFAAVEGTQSKS